ncbi:MAG: right-handed parallel beta-helix repeat-containing protein [Deltaproteobacteria bacterium]|nr:right-handed parallel beta-helix repeat-containing protein [Deltaproteobacteria bacterium]
MTGTSHNTRFFGLSLILAIFATLILSVTAQAWPQFWISPTGHDSNPGTANAPFQSLARARDAVRTVGPNLDADIVVNLYGGTYRLTEPLILDGRDSGRNSHHVVWQAASGHRPVVCGSIPVQGWRSLDGHGNIQVADIPPGIRSRQLFVNGQRAVRAATTDYPTSFLPKGRMGIRYAFTTYNDPAWAFPALWNNPAEIDAVLVSQWKMMICGVESVQSTDEQGSGLLIMKEPAWTNANTFLSEDPLRPGVFGPGLWSFWQVARFENSLSFIDQPGEWAMDSTLGKIYYLPRDGEDLARAEVELPVLESLIVGHGTPEQPVTNIRFQGLTFRYATWLGPSGGQGYVTDQSGAHLVGRQATNIIGHIWPNTLGCAERLVLTPGNLGFTYARKIEFVFNVFEGLGAAALNCGTGCQGLIVRNNRFTDISSSAVQIGGIGEVDHHPPSEVHLTKDNLVQNNLIELTGRDYVDTAAIFVGSTTRTTIKNNTITGVPWSGIALGWGWGLLDPGSFPGLPDAYPGIWEFFDTPTATTGNRIVSNRIEGFLQALWDGGAIYTTGAQGTSLDTGTWIAGNVALAKRPAAGGNVFYTDGGSRFVVLAGNVSFGNEPGGYDFGPPPKLDAPLPYSPIPSMINGMPYGQDIGGCRTYGDILYLWNYWQHDEFFNICPYTDGDGTIHPVNLTFFGNKVVDSLSEVPIHILKMAGIQEPVP